MKNKILFSFILFFIAGNASLWAAGATVTNNGSITVRVQYKTPDGQYEDIGYLKPGETANVPGGVEKVKIVRNPGEWARPLRPGEILDVEVKEDGQVVGKLDWYGGKFFFHGLTEDSPPAVAVGTTPPVVQNPEPPKKEPEAPPTTPEKPKTEETPKETEPSNWPMTGGVWDYLFFLQIFLLGLPFVYLWWRNWTQPKFKIRGELVEGSSLGWGWGWSGGGGCGRYATLNGFFLGLALGGVALWGHSQFSSGSGFLPLFGQDLYMFPYLLLEQLHWLSGPFPEVWWIFLFWVTLSTSCGALSGYLPLKGLYFTPCLLTILPFLLIMRGCAGPHPFAYDGGYGGSELYPPAFTSFISFSMIVSLFLDFVDPYYEMSYHEEDDVADALWDFFHGNPWPLLVFFTGGCLCCFYGCADLFGMDNAVSWYFHDTPLSLGLNFIPPYLMICLFWMTLFGGLGWTLYTQPWRFPFYACLIPAFLVLLFLTMGNYPQRNLDFYPKIDNSYNESFLREPIRELPKKKGESQYQFGDQFRVKAGSNFGSGRDLQYEATEKSDQRRDNNYQYKF